MRATTIAVALVLLVAGCATSEDETVVTTGTRDDGPGQVVERWIDAVIASDVEALSELVDPGGLVILATIENGFSEQATEALLDTGVPPDLIETYWSSFRGGFADFAGIPLQSIEVGGYEEFMVGEHQFATVDVHSGDGSTSVIVSRRRERWRLDLVASFGAAFAGQLRRMLVNLSDTPVGDRIREAFRSEVVPGLLSALRRAPGNKVLGAELERMALLLEE